jgi:FK506-binding nuclear protein
MSAVVLAGLELFPGAEPASILPPDAELPRSALVHLTRATLLCPGALSPAVSPSFYLKAQISESQEVILNALSPLRPSSSLDLAFHADSSPLFSVVGGDEIKGKERETWSVHLSGFVEVEEEDDDDDGEEDGEALGEDEEAEVEVEDEDEDELEADGTDNADQPKRRSLNGAARSEEEREPDDGDDGEEEEDDDDDDDEDMEATTVQAAKKTPQPQSQQVGKRKATSAGSVAAAPPSKQQKTAAAPATLAPAASSAAPKQQKQTAKPSPAAAPSSSSSSPSSSSSSSAVPVTFPNGLQVTEETVGNGAAARTGQRVSIRYTGRLPSGRVFDSNMPRGAPFHFTLGAGECIRGFDLGLKGMRVGGRRRLVIPAELGYGKKGSPPDIPPNSRLDFTVELLKVK